MYHTSYTPFCLRPNYKALLRESLNKWNGFSDINSPLWIHIGTYIKIGLPLTSYWIQLRACVKWVNKILPSAPTLGKPREAHKKVHPKNWNIWPDGLREYISIKYDINFNQLTHLGIIEPYYDQWHPKYNCHPICNVWNEINITYSTKIETSTRPCKLLERD